MGKPCTGDVFLVKYALKNNLPKLVVVLGVQDTDVYFVVISSIHNATQKASPDLLRKKPILEANGRPYLHHDSYVDCENYDSLNIKFFEKDTITHKGKMSENDLEMIRTTIMLENDPDRWSRYELKAMGISITDFFDKKYGTI